MADDMFTINGFSFRAKEVGAIRLTPIVTEDGVSRRALRIYGPAGFQEDFHIAQIILEADQPAKLIVPIEDFGV